MDTSHENRWGKGEDDYVITRVHSTFLLVEKRDLLEGRRTADVISVTSQSQLFQNYQQPMAWFVLYG